MYLPCGIGTGGSIEGDPPGVNLLCIACAVLDNRKPRYRLRGFGACFTDTLNVACLRGLSPFLPAPRGSPVTIEPRMRNASTFPRSVQSNRAARSNSVIPRGKVVFYSCSCYSRCILSAALYRGTAANTEPVRPLPRAAA